MMSASEYVVAALWKFWNNFRALVTYPVRRQENWKRTCGCKFEATPIGWRQTKCLDHWLD